MAELTFQQIFGNSSNTDNIDPVSDNYKVEIDLKDFQNIEDGGQIENNLGISNLVEEYEGYWTGEKGTNLFYALLLTILQNQAENLNDDPEQKIFIQSPTAGLGVGSRDGQIRRTFVVNFFSEGDINALADVDAI